MTEPSADTLTHAPTRPRPLSWALLVTSGASILLVGLAYTAFVLANAGLHSARPPVAFWTWVLVAGFLTIVSLGVRSLRWIFLLRRSRIRVPIADGLIGYLGGLSLLFAPFLLGEMAVRAAIHRRRANIPIASTFVFNLWERFLDLIALAAIAAIAAAQMPSSILLVLVVGTTLIPPVRDLILNTMIGVVSLALRLTGQARQIDRSMLSHLTTHRAWLVALGTSVLAWALPAVGFWGLVHSWGRGVSFASASYAFAASALTGGVVLAPGGVLIVGERLLDFLIDRNGFPEADAALTVLSIRAATAGVATMLGGAFVWMHLRSHRPTDTSHFDAIAPAYAVQIPEARRLALLSTKTRLMQRVLAARGTGPRGLDVGCGPGWYVARMRDMGFDVSGIDESAGQVHAARANVDDPSVVSQGSMLEIPSPAGAYDFVYCINVLHHLPSIDSQHAAFAELLRVLRPGGLLFVHEINTRNALFRFYMGYLFPVLNCIDEGNERWLLPNRLELYTAAPVLEVHYFTFLPEFLPEPVIRLLRPLERLLEESPLRRYSAHYMAVLQKSA